MLEPQTAATGAKALAQRIAAQVDLRRAQALADTARILQFKTVSGGTPEQEVEYLRDIPACLAWLRVRALEMGFEFSTVGGDGPGCAGEIAWNNGDADAPVFVIACHIDVVTPVGSWTHPPFEGATSAGHVWGRGIQDDKGPLIQTLYGLHAVKAAGIKLPCHVRIVVGTKEETGDWDDIRTYLAERGDPDFAFTPDADFPVINGEKGMMSIKFKADWKPAGADAETGLEFVSLNGGERENIVASLCEVVLRYPADAKAAVMRELMKETTEYTVAHPEAKITMLPSADRPGEVVLSFIGKGAHSSTPHMGHNALLDALDFLHSIETLPTSHRQFFRFVWAAAQDLDGTALEIAGEHHFIGATTVNLSLMTVGPRGGEAVVNIRPTMGITCKEVMKRGKDAAARFAKASGIKISATQHGRAVDAIYLDPERGHLGTYLKALTEGFEIVSGRKGELRSTGGTTYSKLIPNCCAFGPVLTPDEPELAHQADERFPVEAVIRNAKIYGTALALLSECKLGKHKTKRARSPAKIQVPGGE